MAVRGVPTTVGMLGDADGGASDEGEESAPRADGRVAETTHGTRSQTAATASGSPSMIRFMKAALINTHAESARAKNGAIVEHGSWPGHREPVLGTGSTTAQARRYFSTLMRDGPTVSSHSGP
jgi:hypothetical protein